MIKEAQIIPRLLQKYREEIVPAMMKRFGYKNKLAVPRLVKITINMGVGKAKETPKRMEEARKDLALITGRRPIITKAKKAVSNFRLRIGDSIGLAVNLRKAVMYEFLDRLISMAIPRIRDFRGLSRKAFDGRGNYNMGLTEQTAFPEISLDKLEFVQGMNISIVTTARTDEEAMELLSLFGMPYSRQ